MQAFTGFRKLAQVSETAWLHVNRARQLILPVPGRIHATLEEHRAILGALGSLAGVPGWMTGIGRFALSQALRNR